MSTDSGTARSVKEPALTIILERLRDLLQRIHDEGAVVRHGDMQSADFKPNRFQNERAQRHGHLVRQVIDIHDVASHEKPLELRTFRFENRLDLALIKLVYPTVPVLGAAETNVRELLQELGTNLALRVGR